MHNSEGVLIIAPVGQDASAMAALLEAEGIPTQVCRTTNECSERIADGAGAVLLTEEGLEAPHLSLLLKVLEAQPAWSELPLIILTSGGESRLSRLLDLTAAAAGSLTLLERPISRQTLLRSVQVALRSRRRQYQARDLLAELENLNQTLEQRVVQRTAEAVEHAERLRLLSAEVVHAEDAERRRISQILHDDLQQLLMAARLHFAAAYPTKGEAKRNCIAREIADMLEQAFELTRSLSLELAPPVLHESGLPAGLQWLASQTAKRYAFEINVVADPSANPEAADVRIFLFRSVRELLLNAVKHAPGSSVRVTLERAGASTVRVVVTDDGPGFDPETLAPRGDGSRGLGLFNIRKRLSGLGGSLRIKSAPGRGTSITLVAPSGPPVTAGELPKRSSKAGRR